MIRINNIKIPAARLKGDSLEEQEHLVKAFCMKKYHLRESDIRKVRIVRRSLDARKKDGICFLYSADLMVKQEKRYLRYANVEKTEREHYAAPSFGAKTLANRPVVAGMGPAGLFCALELAQAGYRPILMERGEPMELRVKNVEEFFAGGPLKENSNVQFGEGGAGTFSDGKLNTLAKDSHGRHKRVLNTFISFGAPKEIGFLSKPHIGTDRLREIIVRMRKEIIRLGGEVLFGNTVTGFLIKDGRIAGVEVNGREQISCEVLVLAIGHSARDTFQLLKESGFAMESKAFAVGVRIEHPQEFIGETQYGSQYKKLPAADYKLACRTKNGRSAYSFCMCPGGFVVNASSEKNRLCVNGMSNYARDERNANSAIIVTVTPEDFDSQDVLAGVEFQRKWEEKAFVEGGGRIPAQRLKDFISNEPSKELGGVSPNCKGAYRLANVRNCLPDYVSESIIEAMDVFGRRMKGFDMGDAVVSGVETRTSSPVRILRSSESLEADIKGVYPCGEGAGYAGGIISAAIDGIKVYEKIRSEYRPYENGED